LPRSFGRQRGLLAGNTAGTAGFACEVSAMVFGYAYRDNFGR
jgi:hypothetical protein